MRNRNAKGGQWTAQQIAAVWSKAREVQGVDPSEMRKDVCGAWIKLKDYARTNIDTGWEIDHIKPVSRAGGDELGNLQPLQWENNRAKGDDWPNWSCTKSAST